MADEPVESNEADEVSDEELDAVAGGYDKNHIPKKKKKK